MCQCENLYIGYNLATNKEQILVPADKMESMRIEEYREFINEILEFKDQNGTLPKYIVLNGVKFKKHEYIQIIETMNEFILETGRNPKRIHL
ncbi:Pseudomurein-binding repeat protein [Methanothermus fervidus DSM 2088]|uniref:Pseudomurein-binding repeat protein n=1 Tax=Methanothermus fervidus (strain ATCC 43054 / DSM 2088 / JCM 10308 / V24 S) TaxID=523846 RepID=E3GXG3_METFV|nr:Pseudomurein-binding repeat protein [Methanothermus fervidus DSM 2088]